MRETRNSTLLAIQVVQAKPKQARCVYVTFPRIISPSVLHPRRGPPIPPLSLSLSLSLSVTTCEPRPAMPSHPLIPGFFAHPLFPFLSRDQDKPGRKKLWLLGGLEGPSSSCAARRHAVTFSSSRVKSRIGTLAGIVLEGSPFGPADEEGCR